MFKSFFYAFLFLVLCLTQFARADIFLLKDGHLEAGVLQRVHEQNIELIAGSSIASFPQNELFSIFNAKRLDPTLASVKLISTLENVILERRMFSQRDLLFAATDYTVSTQAKAMNHFRIGQNSYTTGHLAKAFIQFHLAQEQDPNFAAAYIAQAIILKELDLSREAIVIMEQALTLEPNNPIASQHFTVWKSPAKIDLTTIAELQKHYRGAEYFYQLSHLHLRARDDLAASQAWQRYLQFDPNQISSFNKEARTFDAAMHQFDMHSYREAISIMRTAIRLNRLERQTKNKQLMILYKTAFEHFLQQGYYDTADTLIIPWANDKGMIDPKTNEPIHASNQSIFVLERKQEIIAVKSRRHRQKGEFEQVITLLEASKRQMPKLSDSFDHMIIEHYYQTAELLSSEGQHLEAIQQLNGLKERHHTSTAQVNLLIAQQYMLLAQTLIDQKHTITDLRRDYKNLRTDDALARKQQSQQVQDRIEAFGYFVSALEYDVNLRTKIYQALTQTIEELGQRLEQRHDYFNAAIIYGHALHFDRGNTTTEETCLAYAESYVEAISLNNPDQQVEAWQKLANTIDVKAFRNHAQIQIDLLHSETLNLLSSYFPLAAGNWWKYQTKHGSITIAVSSVEYRADQLVAHMRVNTVDNERSFLSRYDLVVANGSISKKTDDNDAVLANYPFQIGQSWVAHIDSQDYKRTCISTKQSVVINGDRYDKCLQISNKPSADGFISSQWYAPGIGLIQQKFPNQPEKNIRLTSYRIN